MTEHQVVVVFDVTAPDILSAGRIIRAALAWGDRPAVNVPGVESWWMPEEPLRSKVDRNDNAPGRLVFDEDCGTCDRYVSEWPAADCETPEAHAGATIDCPCGDLVTIEQALEQPTKHRRCNEIGASV